VGHRAKKGSPASLLVRVGMRDPLLKGTPSEPVPERSQMDAKTNRHTSGHHSAEGRAKSEDEASNLSHLLLGTPRLQPWASQARRAAQSNHSAERGSKVRRTKRPIFYRRSPHPKKKINYLQPPPQKPQQIRMSRPKASKIPHHNLNKLSKMSHLQQGK
jgi:hypothetical protein